jgi:hypothetical protein
LYSYRNIRRTALFEVILLSRALKLLESLGGTRDEEEIEGVLAKLAHDPSPSGSGVSEDDASARFVYAGRDRRWIISYEIDVENQIIYAHSIDRRPSAVFDPR